MMPKFLKVALTHFALHYCAHRLTMPSLSAIMAVLQELFPDMEKPDNPLGKIGDALPSAKPTSRWCLTHTLVENGRAPRMLQVRCLARCSKGRRSLQRPRPQKRNLSQRTSPLSR